MLGHCLRKETTKSSVAKDVKYRTIHRRAHQKGHSKKYKVCALVRISTHVLRMRGKKLYIRYSNIYPTRCNVTPFMYTWKLLYMFRVVTPPIIRNAYNCIYSICYLSHRYCYLLLSCKCWSCSNSSKIAPGSSNGVTNTRCCKYSCMRS
jgi:hypothetical protein